MESYNQLDKIAMIDTVKLQFHPFSLKLYTLNEQDDFYNSLDRDGIIKALVVTENNFVLDGNSRLNWAKKRNVKSVPCIVRHIKDDLEIRKYIMNCNKYRVKSKWEFTNEFNAELEIQKDEAEKRQKELGKNYGRGKKKETLPEKSGKDNKHDNESHAIASENIGAPVRGETMMEWKTIKEKIETQPIYKQSSLIEIFNESPRRAERAIEAEINTMPIIEQRIEKPPRDPYSGPILLHNTLLCNAVHKRAKKEGVDSDVMLQSIVRQAIT